jgi:hypothetical protein
MAGAVLPLRAACKEAAAAVAAHPWEDSETVIRGRVRDWRACFPRARAANLAAYDADLEVRRRVFPIAAADFVHLAGLRALSIAGREELPGAAFAHLAGLCTLDMRGCSQAGVTDAAFVHLRGIHALNMSGCHQASPRTLENAGSLAALSWVVFTAIISSLAVLPRPITVVSIIAVVTIITVVTIAIVVAAISSLFIVIWTPLLY